MPDAPTQVLYGRFHVPMYDVPTKFYLSVQYMAMYNLSCGDALCTDTTSI